MCLSFLSGSANLAGGCWQHDRNPIALNEKGTTVKKVLIFLVSLLTAVSLFAVIAAASDGGADADAASATTAAAAAEQTDAADSDSDDSEDDAAEQEGCDRDRGAGHGKKGHDRDWDAEGLNWMLAELVSEGVLSEDEVAAVAGWFESQGTGLKERVDGPEGVLEAMVSDGVISQAQADGILELKSRFEEAERRRGWDWWLGELVSEGVLSEDEVAVVAGWFESQGSGLKERVDGPGGVLAAMVSDGVISQAQADRILELKSRSGHGEHGGRK